MHIRCQARQSPFHSKLPSPCTHSGLAPPAVNLHAPHSTPTHCLLQCPHPGGSCVVTGQHTESQGPTTASEPIAGLKPCCLSSPPPPHMCLHLASATTQAPGSSIHHCYLTLSLATRPRCATEDPSRSCSHCRPPSTPQCFPRTTTVVYVVGSHSLSQRDIVPFQTHCHCMPPHLVPCAIRPGATVHSSIPLPAMKVYAYRS